MNLPTDYQTYIHMGRYAKYKPEEGRRENWQETVNRYINFFHTKFPQVDIDWSNLNTQITSLNVMPSMRALMTSGAALDRDNIAGYNCAFTPIDRWEAFSEAMLILMCGTGMGYSVEQKFVEKLDALPTKITKVSTNRIVVEDSKDGWSDAFEALLNCLLGGIQPRIDYTKLRPEGARLNTFGGRASGAEPLKKLFKWTIKLFKRAGGRKIRPVEASDLMCMVADIVVCGGVRRSALICLCDLFDEEMRDYKTGEWWVDNPQRMLANISSVFEDKPTRETFDAEWLSLKMSGSGERGIFSRYAAKEICKKIGRDHDHDFGTNPCCEIILRPNQFCNLTEVVIRSDDDFRSLVKKVEIATILGTLQSSLDDLSKIDPMWEENTKEERLLGVSLTGIFDHPMLVKRSPRAKQWLNALREHAREVNKYYADMLGIEPSAAITCVKPSGTVSQLVDSASGIHPRYSAYYIRTVRQDKKDPLSGWMDSQGFPNEPDVHNDTNTIFSFPIKAPDTAYMRDDFTAIEQMEIWKFFQDEWCEHKPSVTIYVREHEWQEVGDWVYENFDKISGVSFLPHTDHTYQQAPYQEIDEATYLKLLEDMPTDIDWSSFVEEEDNTISQQTLACTAGVCEI